MFFVIVAKICIPVCTVQIKIYNFSGNLYVGLLFCHTNKDYTNKKKKSLKDRACFLSDYIIITYILAYVYTFIYYVICKPLYYLLLLTTEKTFKLQLGQV